MLFSQDNSYYIRDYDKMLLMNKEELKNWRFVGSNLNSVDTRYEAATAIVRHVVRDLMGYTDPLDVYDHFNSRTAALFRLDRVLISGRTPSIPNYGFIRFASLDNINWHYVLWKSYEKEENVRLPFSYSKEALEHYKKTVIFNDQVSRGSLDVTKTKISHTITSEISQNDHRKVIDEFFRYFISEHVLPVMPRTKYGLTHDLYAFFSDEPMIRRLLVETRLDTIFQGEYLTCYDLLDACLPAITRDERVFYRNAYNLISVSR